MSVAMRKIDGVQNVRVSLQEGLTVLDLAPNNSVRIDRLRQVIKNNGFVSKEIEVTAAGTPAQIDGKPAFTVSGTEERVTAAAEPQRMSDGLWKFVTPAPR